MQKEILGYENYTIDENGNIFSKKRNIYLKSFKNKSGYPAIYLCSNGKRKYFTWSHTSVILGYVII